MAGTSGFSGEFEGLKASDSSRAIGGSEPKCLMAPPSGGAGASMASSLASARDESMVGMEDSGERTTFMSVEEQIEKSKSHWSTLADLSGAVGEGEEVAEVSNVEEFTALQLDPTLGGFFQTFGYELPNARYGSVGELVVGKFAEGGQAELYEVQVKWRSPKNHETDVVNGNEWVLKVFKKGTFLKHLKSQLPHGLLHAHVENIEYFESCVPKLLPRPRYYCDVVGGILLEDGRFAFLMRKEDMDLRSLIERNMKLRIGLNDGPFLKDEGECMMYRIALGVDWLHSCNIIHRDLKASNVLVREWKMSRPRWECFVADYECSLGVVGTGFFRAPEILQACEEKKVGQRPEVFSRAADVYSYGMTCYEILTGKLPFEDHPLSPKLLIDLVINQHLRPEIPKYVEDWKRELLQKCWHFDPRVRPSIDEILSVLTSNSLLTRALRNYLKNRYGENFRSLPCINFSK